MKHVLPALLVSANVIAAPCVNSPAITTCRDGEIDSLTRTGLVDLKDIKVKGLTKVSGTLIAKNCGLAAIEVHGMSTIKTSKISDDSYFYGMLQANNSKFEGSLIINSKNAEIASSYTRSIRINSSNTATINLKNSQINGDITFVGSEGIVLCNEGCHISGKINHGILKTTGE